MTDTAVALTPRAPLVARFASRFGVEAGKLLATLRDTAFKQQVDKQTGQITEVSNEEMMALLIVAEQYGLNPFTKEIYAFRDRKRGGIVPIVGIDGWLRIVNEHPQYNGSTFATGIDPAGKLEWIECTIYRKDREHPCTVREYLRENKRDTDAWNGMSNRMLRHRALIQCARIAFGFVGIHDEDEGRAIIQGTATTVSDGVIEDLNASIEAPAAAPAVQIVTYAEVADIIAKAGSDPDLLDVARGFLPAVADERQRAELDAMIRAAAK